MKSKHQYDDDDDDDDLMYIFSCVAFLFSREQKKISLFY